MKKLKRLRPNVHTATLLIVALAVIGLLNFHIFEAAPGLASSEVPLPPFKQSLQMLWNQPLEAPLHLSRLVVAGVSQSTGVALSRLPNILLAFLLVFISYWLIKKWYGYRLTVFGVVLLITAPWFLHVGRIATSDIVYPLAMTIVVALAAAWHQKRWSARTLYVTAIVTAGLCYVPGMLWLLLAVLWFERKHVIENIRAFKKHSVVAGIFFLLTLIPLIHALVVNWKLGKQLLGFAKDWPNPIDFASNFVQSWQYLFFGGFNDPVRNLATLPLVNIFITLAFIVGVYLYSQHRRAIRTKQLFSLWLIGTALVALNGPVSYTVVLPIVFILAIGGIGYLLHLWLKTFPKNPYARNFGIALLSLVVLFAVAYNVRSYYVAWPNAPEVKAAFTRLI